jgi:hypothetical protein
MSDADHEQPEFNELDLDAPAFEAGPISGMPFRKNSEEYRAIERILARRRERERARERPISE